MQYMLLIYNCERPEPGDPGFAEALARVNAFADECRRRGVFVSGHPLQPEHTATTVSVRDGRTLITDGPFAETHEHLGGAYVLDCRNLDEAWSWPRCARWPSWGRSRCGPSSMCRGWTTVRRM